MSSGNCLSINCRRSSPPPTHNRSGIPTIPIRVTEQELQHLRTDVVGIATGHGYPVPQPRGGHAPFDQQLAIHLYEQMGVVPAEAAAGGILVLPRLGPAP